MLAGSLLSGFGFFNVVEGIVDHHILKIHHVNETVPPEQWIYWDVGFLILGAAMIVGGWAWLIGHQRGKRILVEFELPPPRKGAFRHGPPV